MTRKHRRIFILLVTLSVATAGGFCFGPSLIHMAYRIGTPDSERELNQARYHILAYREASDHTILNRKQIHSSEERLRLFYWFHARGWPIDEGWDEDESRYREITRQWRDLFEYWSL